MRTRGNRRTEWSKPLVVLSVVFLGVALWNGALALVDAVVWRGATAAGCAVASVALLAVAATGRRR